MSLSSAIDWLARILALLGGVVLVVITTITVVSVTGRAMIPLGLGPVPGDFELVEAGVGFAIFSFLPWCQLKRGHATVDIFTSFLSDTVNRWIDVVAEVLMTIVIWLIAWRLWLGMHDKIRYHETTFILQYPIWWAYAACMVAAAVAALVSLYVLYARVAEAATGRAPALPGEGTAP